VISVYRIVPISVLTGVKTIKTVYSGQPALLLVVLAVILAAAMVTPVHAGSPAYHILILNSYNPGLAFSDNEVAGVRQAFSNESADFTIEYMDSKRITTPEYRDLLLQSYRMRYSKSHFDAILSFDDDAFQFLLSHADSLFPDTPVFFCGVNNFNDSMLAGHPQFTGVVETLSRNETIDVALRLHPGTERVLVVTDRTTSGEINRRILEGTIASGRFPVPVLFLDENRSGLSLEELKNKLAAVPPHSVVYFSDFFQDRNNVTYLPGAVMEQLSPVSAAPIYVHGDQYLGHGAVGGMVDSGLLQGEAAGTMAIRVLHGGTVSSIPVYKEGMNRYMFDSNQLKRWNIPGSSLPEGSIIINQEESVLEKYGLWIAAVVLFILVETWIIIVLLLNRRKRMRAEQDLLSSDETLRSLINANPESVILVKPDGTILYSNEVAASRLNTTPAAMLGKDLFAMMPPETAKGRKERINEAISTGREVRSVDERAGRIFDITVSPVPGPAGSVEKIAILAIDITDSQQLQETLRRINRKLKNLSDITRTDLENRTYAILGYINLLGTCPAEPARSEYLEKVQLMIRSLSDSVRFSRQYQDLGGKLPVWQEIRTTILYAFSHVTLGTVRYEIQTGDVEIFADLLLENAFLYLVNWSLEPGNAASVIRISCREENGMFILVYEDDGTGIPEPEKAKLFNPDYPEYRQIFIVHEILDITGITIRETGDPARGARFEILIPRGLYRFLRRTCDKTE